MTTIAVLGDGSWGTAIALHLAQNPAHRVRLWSARPENARLIREARENTLFLPGCPLPESILLTADEAEAVEHADIWVSAIPTIYLRMSLERFSQFRGTPATIVSLTKGIEIETFQRPSQMIQQLLDPASIVVLSGPSHAEEVAQGMPCSLVAACEESIPAKRIQHLFTTDRFRVYTNEDIIGVEIAGALKNVIGIAAGVSDGLNFGDNAKSALLTRGLVEMARFGMALGAEHATFYGLAGIGDLITTCISQHGRNRRVGEKLGQGQTLEQILSATRMVAEGVTTAKSVHDRTQSMKLEMPIMTGVYQILYEGRAPLGVVHDLMTRMPRKE